MPTVNIQLGERSYPVMIGNGLLDRADLWNGSFEGFRRLVVSNEVVAPLYLDRLVTSIGSDRCEAMILPDGESAKTVANWSLILDRLAAMKASRDTCLVALGGGVVGDICGFAAAAYMRGVPFIQVPTTLLSQVDASVGGKTAVNHPQGKNLVGAFHQPAAVFIDIDTLDTLPEREFRAGMAEVIKYGMIRDAEFFEWLESRSEAIAARDNGTLAFLIEQCVRNKAEVVAEDELEAGPRALLNFGHTFGHALETIGGYERLLHGEAVAIGMVIAARLSELRGLCAAGVSARLAGLLEKFRLPVSPPHNIEADALLSAMEMDKKVLGGCMRLVLLNSLGSARVDDGSSAEDVIQCLDTFA